MSLLPSRRKVTTECTKPIQQDALMSRPASGVSRISAVQSSSGNAQFQEEVAPKSLKNQIKDVLKLVLIVLPQLVALVVISTLLIQQVVFMWNSSSNLKEHILRMKHLTHLISDLQRERSMSCLSLSSTGLDQDKVVENLTDARFHTNEALHVVEAWLGHKKDGIEMETKRGFEIALFHHRHKVDRNAFGCLENILWFTSKIDIILAQLQRIFHNTEDGDLWHLIASKTSLLKAKDLFGVKSALGGSYFAAGQFDQYSAHLFHHVNGGGEYLFNASTMSYPKNQDLYDQLLEIIDGGNLLHDIHEMETIIDGDNKNMSGNVKMGFHWYEDMNEYMEIMVSLDDAATEELVSKIGDKLSQAGKIFYFAMGVVVFAALVCPPSMTWYVWEARKMQRKIRIFTDKLLVKAKELKQEKQKTDMILYQMLPVTIANELKQSKPVAPEHFQSVTLYFSDIKGFTTLSGKSSPLQVVTVASMGYSPTACSA